MHTQLELTDILREIATSGNNLIAIRRETIVSAGAGMLERTLPTCRLLARP